MLLLACKAATNTWYHSRWNSSLTSRGGILTHPFKHWVTGGKDTKSLTALLTFLVNTFLMGNTHFQEKIDSVQSLAERYAQVCSQLHRQRGFRTEHETSRILSGASLWFMDKEVIFLNLQYLALTTRCSCWRQQKRLGKMVESSKSFLEGCNQWTEAHRGSQIQLQAPFSFPRKAIHTHIHRHVSDNWSDNTYSNASLSLFHHNQVHHSSPVLGQD